MTKIAHLKPGLDYIKIWYDRISINIFKFCSILFILIFVSCDEDPSLTEPIENEFQEYTWNVSTPEQQNVDPMILDSAFIQADNMGFVDGLLVIRNGFIIAEEYYNGYYESRPHNVLSVSKSFLSAITGVALNEGYLNNLDETVLDYFPEYIYTGIDERKYDITIRHLLTMRMGIEGEAANDYDVYWELYNSDNWIKETIEMPLLYDPGERMRYNTFQTHLLSAILTLSSDTNTLQLARELLTNPMGITIDGWEQGPSGYYFGGNSMYFTPREMATLGYLYLNHGELNGNQIIPREWVSQSLTKTWEQDNSAWGVLTDYNYGYLWWLGKINGYDLFMALGYGGQFVVVFPDLDLIVVSTAYYNVGPEVDHERPILELISKYIIPAIQN